MLMGIRYMLLTTIQRTNMRFVILILINFISMGIYSQEQVDTVLTSSNGNNFYLISTKTNKRTLIFLHGGVQNPYFKQRADKIELTVLIENNSEFVEQATRNGFNILIPITNDSLNWLDNPQRSFTILKEMIKISNAGSKEKYISGFSDGGTGSFKLFYSYPDFFNGLVVFNGYPQHSNFFRSVEYDTIEDKKILFISTNKDKVIPYEFLLTEYCKQKKTNANTFFYLGTGNHSFTNYTSDDFSEVFAILTNKNQNTKTEPIQGFIKNDRIIQLYLFRKKIVTK